MQLPSKKTLGFTLIELLVTISIIGVLAAIGTLVYASAQKTSRISKRVQDLQALGTAIELYKASTGYYPIRSTWACIGSLTGTNSLEPNYMPKIPADPLDGGDVVTGQNCYQYQAENVVAKPSEYKVRTNPNLTTGTIPEMQVTDFAQQPTLIDPSSTSRWAIYSGSNARNY